MPEQFAVVDLFAGPGGLAEGFSRISLPNCSQPFPVVLSVEKDAAAYETLRLRSFLRQFPNGFPDEYYDFLNGRCNEPDWSSLYPVQWNAASETTLRMELGTDSTIDTKLDAIKERHGAHTVLIGGPPCQSYSLVGRARNSGKPIHEIANDPRTTLYQEYIRILAQLRPAAFVLENVKGILSFLFNSKSIFQQILQDIRDVGYQLIALCPISGHFALNGTGPAPEDFVVRTEIHGVPQARHRVIVIGLEEALAKQIDPSRLAEGLLKPADTATVRDVLFGMPIVRSGISREEDSHERWLRVIRMAMKKISELQSDLQNHPEFQTRKEEIRKSLKGDKAKIFRKGTEPVEISEACPRALREWIRDPKLKQLTHHETRSHITADLERYFFAAVYSEIFEISARAKDFPSELAPNHRNWNSGKFADRYRVQLWDKPSKTITCHIAKDGHYYIHPDPAQCRSLTVREAARLQTFPDDYFFKGNRTQQYVQVGNAVPPFLAKQIADTLYTLLLQATGAKTQVSSRSLLNGAQPKGDEILTKATT